MKLFLKILGGIFLLFVLYIVVCMSIGVVIGVFIRYAFIVVVLTILVAAIRSAYNRWHSENDAARSHVRLTKQAEKMLKEMERKQ